MAETIYVVNGFYMSMREKYTADGAKIHYFTIEWPEAKCSWTDFRGKVLGATDPVESVEGALRKLVFKQWKDLGLASEPNVGDNGVHASASPFEALAERMNWLSVELEADSFGKAMLEAKIPKETIMLWSKDPQVEFEGKTGSLFDLLEDLDASACLKKAMAIAKVEGTAPEIKTNAAFVFVKPHAVFPKVMELVKKTFSAKNIEVKSEGDLDGKTIESKKLVDNHYYSIASKASLTKPKDLNPPDAKKEEFEKLFGLSWELALRSRVVYNAVDGCKKLKVSGDKMDEIWAGAKKAKQLVKFGGGFYVGRIEYKQPLLPAVWAKISDITPASKGMNLKVKVVSSEVKFEKEGVRVAEAIVGDDTGIVALKLRNEQVDACTEGKVMLLRNVVVNMQRSRPEDETDEKKKAAAKKKATATIRLEVNLWGKMEASEGEIKVNSSKDLSAEQYEQQ